MSSYIHFAIKQEDTAIELNCFCRSSAIYGITEKEIYTIYEGWVEANQDSLKDMMDNAQERIDSYKETMEENMKLINDISGFSNSVEDKIEAVIGLYSHNREIEEEILEYECAYHFFQVMYDMIDNWKYYGEDEPKPSLYIGLEASIEDLAKGILNPEEPF